MASIIRFPLPSPDPQLLQVEALRAACDRVLIAASRGEAFSTKPGVELVDAFYQLTEVDAVWDWARDLEKEFSL